MLWGTFSLITDEDEDYDATLIDPTLVEEDFLSDDDSVDFDAMVDIPTNRADNGHEAYLSPTHAGNKLKDESWKLATKYSSILNLFYIDHH